MPRSAIRTTIRAAAWFALGSLAHLLLLGPIDWSSPADWGMIAAWPLTAALAALVTNAPLLLLAMLAWIAWSLLGERTDRSGDRRRARPF